MKFDQNIINVIRKRPLLFKLMFMGRLYLGRDMVPPPALNFVGYPEFKKIGAKYLEYIKEFTGLSPEHTVLDIGCGIGRTAIPMTGYMNTGGRYEGFDIVDLGISWCSRKIGRRYPNFNFVKADIGNNYYNPKGSIKVENYCFPYPDNTFDVVYATSVFTHMMPEGVNRYINEMERVLTPGGKSLCTFFVLDAASIQTMVDSDFPFTVVEDGYGVINEADPENAIAYRIDDIRELYKNAGLSILEPIRFGDWSGRGDSEVGGQDMIISEKPRSS